MLLIECVYSGGRLRMSTALYETGFMLPLLVSVYKAPLNIGECIYLVSFWGYKKYKPYFIPLSYPPVALHMVPYPLSRVLVFGPLGCLG